MHQRQHTGEFAKIKGELAFDSQVGNMFLQNLKMNRSLPRRLHTFSSHLVPRHFTY